MDNVPRATLGPLFSQVGGGHVTNIDQVSTTCGY